MSLGARLFLLFTVVPLVEIYLLMKLQPLMGAEATIGLVVLTGLLGAVLARREGGRVLRRWQESMARGQVPEDGLLSTALVLVGGVLLVTPGVLTDATGILLLVPPTRRLIARGLKRYLERRFKLGEVRQGVTISPPMGPDMGPPPPEAGGPIIDVEVVPVEHLD